MSLSDEVPRSDKVIITFAELQQITSEAFKRIALKEKGLPMKGNFYPKLRQDYNYRLEYDFNNLCEIYHYTRIEQALAATEADNG